jgi:hypothetical protein
MKSELKAQPDIKVVDLKRITTLLEPGELGAMLDFKVWDPKTGVVLEECSKKAESFLAQFIQLLWVKMAVTTSFIPMSITDITNTPRDVANTFAGGGQTYAQSLFRANALAADVAKGIIIGSGITAPTIDDRAIEVIIPHATMNYSAQSFAAPAADTTTSQMTLTRNFANVSGGSVTVNELAVYVDGYYTSLIYPYTIVGNFCIIRDVVPGGIVVPNGQTLTVNYRLQAVV